MHSDEQRNLYNIALNWKQFYCCNEHWQGVQLNALLQMNAVTRQINQWLPLNACHNTQEW